MMSQAAGSQDQSAAGRTEPLHAVPIAAIRAGLDAAFRWWRVGRHYRPERRYMRGRRQEAAQAPLVR